MGPDIVFILVASTTSLSVSTPYSCAILGPAEQTTAGRSLLRGFNTLCWYCTGLTVLLLGYTGLVLVIALRSLSPTSTAVSVGCCSTLQMGQRDCAQDHAAAVPLLDTVLSTAWMDRQHVPGYVSKMLPRAVSVASLDIRHLILGWDMWESCSRL